MTTQLDYIIDDLKESFDGKPWYGESVMKKLNRIDWRRVNTQDYGSKSIAVLVQHIINWRVFVLKKLQGDAVYNIVIDGPNDWTAIQINDEKEWNLLKLKLVETQKDLLDALASRTHELLNEQVPGKNYTFGPILQSIAQHDIYHLGQIGMLNTKKT